MRALLILGLLIGFGCKEEAQLAGSAARQQPAGTEASDPRGADQTAAQTVKPVPLPKPAPGPKPETTYKPPQEPSGGSQPAPAPTPPMPWVPMLQTPAQPDAYAESNRPSCQAAVKSLQQATGGAAAKPVWSCMIRYADQGETHCMLMAKGDPQGLGAEIDCSCRGQSVEGQALPTEYSAPPAGSALPCQ